VESYIIATGANIRQGTENIFPSLLLFSGNIHHWCWSF